jgi:hypothetical protein
MFSIQVSNSQVIMLGDCRGEARQWTGSLCVYLCWAEYRTTINKRRAALAADANEAKWFCGLSSSKGSVLSCICDVR